MASTYSNLKIELITTGEQTGTWGGTTNTNLGTALEEAIVGRATANFTSDANLTITLTNTNATQVARNYILNVTSGVSLTVTRNLIVPSINKPYIIENNTTGGQSIVVKTAAGTGVTVPNGKRTMVYANTTNVVAAENHIPDLTLGAALPVASGGTGITSFGAGIATFLGTPSSANLAAALTDETGSGANVFATSPTLVTPILGTPASGVMTNVTGLPLTTGVTGTLPVANGGTGVTTSTGTGSVVLSASPTFTGTVTAGGYATVNNGVNASSYTATNTGGVLSLAIDNSAGSGFGLAYSTNLYSSANTNFRIWVNGGIRYTLTPAGDATTQGSSTSASFIPTSSTLPTNGMYLPAANTVAIATNTTERVRIDASGNVGIGASNPAFKLDVREGSIVAGTGSMVLYGRSSASFPSASFATGYFALGTNNSDAANGGLTIYTRAADVLAEKMRIDANGNVNIAGLTASRAVATDASKNLVSVATTGTGSYVLATSPTLVTPVLGTPSSGTLTSCTGLPVSTGVSGLGTGVATALGINVGSAGAPVVNGGVLGTPSSGTLTSCTGLPISTGVSGLGTGAATFLATPSSANLAALLTDETGTGANVFATSPTLAGTPLAPTAAAGTNTTQISTTAFVTAAIQTLHPVGSIYTSTVATNPATLFGFGTWVAFGAGRVLIGNGGGFAAGATGGSADAVVVAHTHTGTTSTTTALTGSATFISETWAANGTGTGIFSKVGLNPASGTPTSTDTSNAGQLNIDANHNHTFTTGSTGVSATNANLQPYVVVYMWNRTA